MEKNTTKTFKATLVERFKFHLVTSLLKCEKNHISREKLENIYNGIVEERKRFSKFLFLVYLLSFIEYCYIYEKSITISIFGFNRDFPNFIQVVLLTNSFLIMKYFILRIEWRLFESVLKEYHNIYYKNEDKDIFSINMKNRIDIYLLLNTKERFYDSKLVNIVILTIWIIFVGIHYLIVMIILLMHFSTCMIVMIENQYSTDLSLLFSVFSFGLPFISIIIYITMFCFKFRIIEN